MILIDSNALVILLVGLVDPNLFSNHKRTSIYDNKDFNDLVSIIGSFEQLVVLPNVWTETDNLLNSFSGDHKYVYIQKIKDLIKGTTEVFVPTIEATKIDFFYELGVTDCSLLTYAKQCKLFITSDSALSDYAIASNIVVYDLVKNKNSRLY